MPFYCVFVVRGLQELRSNAIHQWVAKFTFGTIIWITNSHAVHSSYGRGIWVAAGHFISRLSNLKISCPPPAEAVHAAAIPFTEILRGFSSWNPDTSGDARNEKSVMLFHASVMALRMIFAAPLQSALRQSSGCSVNPCRSPVSSVCFRQEQVYRRDVPCSSL